MQPTRLLAVVSSCLLAVGLVLIGASPASAHGGGAERNQEVRTQLLAGDDLPAVLSDNVVHQGVHPGQLAISGCFLQTKPLFVTSGVESVQVWDVSDPVHPQVTGTLPNALFENEAMNCGERRTRDGVRRFALIGVDSVQASPTDPSHVNAGGNELIVVDVTDPTQPVIAGRAPGSTSTHTVACIHETNCRYAYSAGDSGRFSIFDLRDLDHPKEVDASQRKAGVQAFTSPTSGHKWNFDDAGYGTHTGFDGASIWDVSRPRHPRLVTTTGRAGRGTDPDHQGWNDFILHNSARPNASAFKPHSRPSFRHGNVLLVTEEDYEQTDCARAGSFQTWWVKSLSGRDKSAIVPLDKVELADLGNFPVPQGAFCSSHWFDFRPGGIVAAGFYGGGTQFIDARHPRHLKSFGFAHWGASEVWDAMWVPVYDARGHETARRTNLVYSIDLVRGLDVYSVDVPGDGIGTQPTGGPSRALSDTVSGAAVPLGLVLAGLGLAFGLRRRQRLG